MRHYTRKGLISAEKNPDNGYRLYDHSALKHLRFIQQARTLGFSLKQIEQIFEHEAHGDSPCPMVRDMLQRKVTETRDKILELQTLLGRMEHAMSAWGDMADGVPDGHSICCLIEQWEQDATKPNSSTTTGCCDD